MVGHFLYFAKVGDWTPIMPGFQHVSCCHNHHSWEILHVTIVLLWSIRNERSENGQNYHSLIFLHLQLRCGGKLNDIWIWKTIFQPFSDRRAGTDRHCDQNREKWCCWTFENLRIWKFVKRVNGDESLPDFGWLTFNELRCASAANSTLMWKHEGLWALFSFYELWMKYDIDFVQIVKKISF